MVLGVIMSISSGMQIIVNNKSEYAVIFFFFSSKSVSQCINIQEAVIRRLGFTKGWFIFPLCSNTASSEFKTVFPPCSACWWSGPWCSWAWGRWWWSCARRRCCSGFGDSGAGNRRIESGFKLYVVSKRRLWQWTATAFSPWSWCHTFFSLLCYGYSDGKS